MRSMMRWSGRCRGRRWATAWRSHGRRARTASPTTSSCAAGSRELNSHVRRVEVVDPLTVRFVLNEPWPDFMTFYGTTATAAGLVVPKRYVTQVGDEGFRKHPIGAGPYKFVSHTPGVEVIFEANPEYWRLVPSVKRLVMRSVPEGTTRVAMLKNGEADIAFALDGPDAENVKRDPRL